MTEANPEVPIHWFDLAAESLGGAVLWANDEFFAEKENLLRPTPAVWKEDLYTDRGKWMDGWETRRRRTMGHDWCIVRLGVTGLVRKILVDTAFFRGNFPESCSVEGCVAASDATVEWLETHAHWHEIVPQSLLRGDSKNWFDVDDRRRFTHVRFHIYPDGGVARLRVYGEPLADPDDLAREGLVDLASMLAGATTMAQSDMFFGLSQNMLKPGRGKNMGDGWETRRRRGPGHDWAVVQLAAEGVVERVEVDTHHFKGNYPDRFSLEVHSGSPEEPSVPADVPLVAERKLMAHTRHFVDVEDAPAGTHAVLRIYPDGGVSRFRMWGRLTDRGQRDIRLRWLNAMPDDEARTTFSRCCGSTRWADAMASLLPVASAEALTAVSDDVWFELGREDWLEAYAAHPRIGARKSSGWSAGEQASVASAEATTLGRLEQLNDAYFEKHGFIFIICATGKSPEQMLAALEARLENDTDTEIANAASEQAEISKLRLHKLLAGQ